jgi:hypothetical protein
MINDNLFELKDLNINSLKIPTDYVIEQKHLAYDYQCMLQFHLPNEPLQCSSCDSLICRSCSLKLLQIDDRCPSCRNKLISKELSRLIKLTLHNFTIKCLNRECDKTISYENYTKHYITCDYTTRQAKCTGCNTVVDTTNKLKEITEHNRGCNFRETCRFCFKVFFVKDMKDHLEICEEREIICLYCEEKYIFSKQSQHWLKQCFVNYLKTRDEKIAELEEKNKELLKTNKANEFEISMLKNLVKEKQQKLALRDEALNEFNYSGNSAKYNNALIEIKNIVKSSGISSDWKNYKVLIFC